MIFFLDESYRGVYLFWDLKILPPPSVFPPKLQSKNRVFIQGDTARANFLKVCCGCGIFLDFGWTMLNVGSFFFFYPFLFTLFHPFSIPFPFSFFLFPLFLSLLPFPFLPNPSKELILNPLSTPPSTLRQTDKYTHLESVNLPQWGLTLSRH